MPFSNAIVESSPAAVEAGSPAFAARADRAVRSRRMPHFDLSRQVLAETRGTVRAALLVARAQACYDQLYARRPRFRQPALRRHLERNILTGLALYRTLIDENDNKSQVKDEIDRVFAAWVEHSPPCRLLRLLGRLFRRVPFTLLRIGNRLVLGTSYPPAGWRCERLEDGRRRVAYDIRRCFYLDMLTVYGVPELTARYCRGDDVLFGGVPGLSWERTQTLGRGGDRCDFRFRHC